MQIHQPYIQIAGVLDFEELQMLVECRVPYIGFPLVLDYHKEDMPASEVKSALQKIHSGFEPVLITYLRSAKEINDLCKYLGSIRIVQLHSDIQPSEVLNLHRLNPNLFVIKSLIVKDNNLIELKKTIDEYKDCVNAFITDTYDSLTGACGATGKLHDWQLSRLLVQYSSKPIILAGGLNPENVHYAIEEVCPFGVDVHTGVEGDNKRKTKELVELFMSRGINAFKNAWSDKM